ncbi:uridine kinase [Patescibacteria group bacterium]
MSYIIGIGGGTGSGKTTIAEEIVKKFSKEEVTSVAFDHYYKDISHLNLEERSKQNFDHPDSLDADLLVAHIKSLKNGKSIERPSYDFSQHIRLTETTTIQPSPVIIIEGILTLSYPELVSLFDMKIFVDTEADIRFIRRLKRDIEERSRSLDSVVGQYQDTVRPMHIEFVEPSKRVADMIIPEGRNDAAIDTLISFVSDQIKSFSKE